MPFIIRKVSVRWKGGAKGGTRTIASPRRAGGARRTNALAFDPAELVAAAHASSFSRELLKELEMKPSAAGEICTSATLPDEEIPPEGARVTIHLHVVAKLRHITQGAFIDAAVRAKTNCLVSRLLRANISMNAKLEK